MLTAMDSQKVLNPIATHSAIKRRTQGELARARETPGKIGRELLDEGRTEGIATGKADLLTFMAETRLGPLPDWFSAKSWRSSSQ